MDEVSTDVERKKEASKKVKALKAEIQNNEAEASQLMAHKQHLQRCIQIANERHDRLEKQVCIFALSPSPPHCIYLSGLIAAVLKLCRDDSFWIFVVLDYARLWHKA